MMHTTSTIGFPLGFALLGGFHALAVLAVGIGILFLVFWATKRLRTEQLLTWGIGLVAAGIAACLLMIGLRTLWQGSGMGARQAQMMHTMMMEQDETGEHAASDAMAMSMDDMSAMLEGKTGDDFDAAFIAGMIPHHQGAIDMARAALRQAQHDEIKRLARDIIDAQQREIDMMQEWQRSWGYTE